MKITQTHTDQILKIGNRTYDPNNPESPYQTLEEILRKANISEDNIALLGRIHQGQKINNVCLNVTEIESISEALGIDSFVLYSNYKIKNKEDQDAHEMTSRFRWRMGNRLVLQRLALGWNTADVAAMAGVSRTTLANAESGEADLQISNLLRIIYVLNLKPTEIINFEEDKIINQKFMEILKQNSEPKVKAEFEMLNEKRKEAGGNPLEQKYQAYLNELYTASSVNERKVLLKKIDRLFKEHRKPSISDAVGFLGVATVLGLAGGGSVFLLSLGMFSVPLVRQYIKRKSE